MMTFLYLATFYSSTKLRLLALHYLPGHSLHQSNRPTVETARGSLARHHQVVGLQWSELIGLCSGIRLFLGYIVRKWSDLH